jgi:shikimate kinase
MALVWVTGNSGAGKSTICTLLRGLGYAAIDTDDDGYCAWIDRATGNAVADPPDPLPEGWLDGYGWVIDRAKVEALATDASQSMLYLCGSAENESDVRDLFDLVVCLVIDEHTLRDRLAHRTNNAFGQHPEELDAALYWNSRTEAAYRRRGATIIDATQPVEAVVRDLLAAVATLA